MDNIKLADEFIQKLKARSNIFNSFGPIFEKATEDGYLHCAHLTLSNIFKQELKFAVQGQLTRNVEVKSRRQASLF